MATVTLAEKLRGNLNQVLQDNLPIREEFVPDFGKTRVRIIPGNYSFGPNGENELFYWNYGFHYLPGTNKDEKGEYVYTNQIFPDESKCPIDEVVEQMFKSEDKKIKSIASKIKRKRVYYFHAILLEEGKEPKLIILKDNTSEGKLANKICSIMGMPFVKDATQKRPWIIKSEQSEGKPIYDLIDYDNGHDLVIDKRKGKAIPLDNGQTIYDIDYSETFAWAQPRPLSEKERELIKELPDFKTINKIETDRSVVEAKLNKFLNSVTIEDTTETPVKPASKTASVKPSNPALNVKTETQTDQTEEQIIAELTAAAAG